MEKKIIKKSEILYESVRLKKAIVDKVRESKINTGVAIGSFFEIAAQEKLSTIKNK